MTRAGKAALAKRNAEASAAYLKQQAPKVAEVLREKKTIVDVWRELGMSPNAVKKIVAMGEATYSKEISATVATQRRVASRLKRARARAALVESVTLPTTVPPDPPL